MKKKKKKKRGPNFSMEEKLQALELLDRGDVTVEQLAKSLGVAASTLRRWRDQVARAEAGQPMSAAQKIAG